MGNKVFNLLLICIFIITFPLHSTAKVEDSACLTCHQYPGLVRQDDNTGLKILHIDSEKYRTTPHGHLDCKACHLDVDKIPHVGNNMTTCQSGCHQSDKDIALLAKTPRKGFHRNEQSVITNLEDKTSCKVCHKIYPHKKEPFARAFLNMHTGYMVCEVCHLDRSKFTVSRYDWVQTRDVAFQGDAFGSFYTPDNNISQKSDSILSRIAPYVYKDGKLQALMNTWDTDGAHKVCSSRSRLDEDEKTIEIRHYHRDVVKMEHTTACVECHSSMSMIDFSSLGFTTEQAVALKNLNIGNIIKKYEVFYMPSM